MLALPQTVPILLLLTTCCWASSSEDSFEYYRHMMRKSFDAMERQIDEIIKNFWWGFEEEGHHCLWIDEGHKKILPLDFRPVKNSPLNVDIKEGQIIIKGQVKQENRTSTGRSIHMSSLHISCPIPNDVDPDGIKVELAQGKYQIEMPKKSPEERKRHRRPHHGPRPLFPKDNDISV